jgi:hypothetical protein
MSMTSRARPPKNKMTGQVALSCGVAAVAATADRHIDNDWWYHRSPGHPAVAILFVGSLAKPSSEVGSVLCVDLAEAEPAITVTPSLT